MFDSSLLANILLDLEFIIFKLIGFGISLVIIIGIVALITFAVIRYVKKFNAMEEESQKKADERHMEAEENMKDSAVKHAENMANIEEEMLTEKIKCSYCGKYSVYRVGTDFTCPYCGANATGRDMGQK